VPEEPAQPRLLPLAAEMTRSEREAYERDCLVAVERIVENMRSSPHEFNEVHEISLVGSYPETAIVVSWVDKRDGREWERGYHLWINPVTRKPPGSFEYPPSGKTVGREPPSQVGMLIHTWISEHGGAVMSGNQGLGSS
jgi:hypothetical protein